VARSSWLKSFISSDIVSPYLPEAAADAPTPSVERDDAGDSPAPAAERTGRIRAHSPQSCLEQSRPRHQDPLDWHGVRSLRSRLGTGGGAVIEHLKDRLGHRRDKCRIVALRGGLERRRRNEL
jgi:hypothetical protein